MHIERVTGSSGEETPFPRTKTTLWLNLALKQREPDRARTRPLLTDTTAYLAVAVAAGVTAAV